MCVKRESLSHCHGPPSPLPHTCNVGPLDPSQTSLLATLDPLPSPSPSPSCCLEPPPVPPVPHACDVALDCCPTSPSPLPSHHLGPPSSHSSPSLSMEPSPQSLTLPLPSWASPPHIPRFLPPWTSLLSLSLSLPRTLSLFFSLSSHHLGHTILHPWTSTYPHPHGSPSDASSPSHSHPWTPSSSVHTVWTFLLMSSDPCTSGGI
jgi:hypothetical protein